MSPQQIHTAYKAYPRNNPGKTFFPNWWILDWSFAVIQWCSTNEPTGMIGLVNGSPKRLSNGVSFFRQTRDLELFAHSYSTPWNLFTNCRLDLIATNTAEVPSFTLHTALSAFLCVPDLCGIDVRRFQERSSQALSNSKELSVYMTLGFVFGFPKTLFHVQSSLRFVRIR